MNCISKMDVFAMQYITSIMFFLRVRLTAAALIIGILQLYKELRVCSIVVKSIPPVLQNRQQNKQTNKQKSKVYATKWSGDI